MMKKVAVLAVVLLGISVFSGCDSSIEFSKTTKVQYGNATLDRSVSLSTQKAE